MQWLRPRRASRDVPIVHHRHDEGASAAARATQDSDPCWICHEGGSQISELISPCKCTGSMKYVHRHCLDRWRSTAPNPFAFTTCRHCAYQYILVRRETEHKEADEARRKVLKIAIRHFLVANVALQAWLIGLALLIRLVDQHEVLVKVFDFRQIEGMPPAGEASFLDSLRGRKTTYYMAAILFTAAIIGVWGTTVACIRHCCSGPSYSTGPHCDCGTFYWFDPWCECPCCPSTRHPDAEFCPGCEGNCCPNSSSSNCNCDGGGDDFGACFLCCAIIVIVFAFLGIFYACMAVVAWFQSVAKRYLQTIELRELTLEWVVQDLECEEYKRSLESGLVVQGVVTAVSSPSPRSPKAATTYGAAAPGQVQMPSQAQGTQPEQSQSGNQQLLRHLSSIFGLGDFRGAGSAPSASSGATSSGAAAGSPLRNA